MSSNIVPLFKPKPKVEVVDMSATTNATPAAIAYMGGFYDWAAENGIDTSTQSFKYEAAAIMTLIQGMFLREKYGQ